MSSGSAGHREHLILLDQLPSARVKRPVKRPVPRPGAVAPRNANSYYRGWGLTRIHGASIVSTPSAMPASWELADPILKGTQSSSVMSISWFASHIAISRGSARSPFATLSTNSAARS